MMDEIQRENLLQTLLTEPGAAIPGWVEECMAVHEADEAARQERLVANIQTLIENDVEGVEDMNALEVFFAIVKLENAGVIPKPWEEE